MLFCGIVNGQSWAELSSYPDTIDGRNHPVTFALNGFGYVLTGDGNSGELDDMLKYDPINDTWSVLASFPGGERSYSYGVTSGNKAYVGFGYNFQVSVGQTYFNDFWEFDGNTETWTQLTSCPCEGRRHPAMVATDSKVFVGLGSKVNATDLKDWWEYDISTDTWTQKTDFPSTERHHPYHFSIDNIIYVGLGHHGASIFNDFYKYDLVADTWTSIADLPAQGRVAGTQFSLNGKGYILSGQGENHDNLLTGEFWEYDPIVDAWDSLLPHPGSGRWAPGTFIIDGKVYLTGGQTLFDERDLWVFDFTPILSNNTIDFENAVIIGPNPGSGLISIQSEYDIEQINVYNLVGQKVLQLVLPRKVADLRLLENGYYILNLHFNGQIVSKKIQIIR